MVRFLDVFKPIARVIPEVRTPKRRTSIGEKLIWTAFALIAYLVMSEIPLYGVGVGYDPFGAWRVIFASNRGTLTELGIIPIVDAGLILQMLAGSGLIAIDLSRTEDRALFSSAMKAMALIITVVIAFGYTMMGAYGAIPLNISIIVFAQLVGAELVIIMLDEMLQKGWGLGSGISLFILAGVCRTIWWNCFSPIAVEGGFALGVLVAFFQSLMAGNVGAVLYRGTLPDAVGLLSTAIIFSIIIYLESVRTELPVSHTRFRGVRGTYPIKLMYISVIPVIFAGMLFFDYTMIAQILWTRAGEQTGILWSIIGQFEYTGDALVPVAGLAYYMTGPRSIAEVALDPVRAAMYAALMIGGCALFAKLWVNIGGVGPSDVARQLIDAGMFFPGFRRSERVGEWVLQRYIPTIAILGGLIIGAIAALSDFFGVFGSGTGILLAIEIAYQYYGTLTRERALDMYPGLGAFLGR